MGEKRRWYISRNYENCQSVTGKLSWTHYCELLTISDRNKRQKNYKAINYISNKIFKLTCAFSICICSVFLFFSNELGLVIYNNLETGYYFKIFAPLVFFMYMDKIIDCILKGLNKQFGVMCCNILDLSITTCFIYFLLPIYGINGYITSIFISELLNFSVSLFQMIKYSKLKINFIDWLLNPLICSLISYFITSIFHFNIVNLTVNLIANIILFIIIYLATFLLINKGTTHSQKM